MSIQDYPKFSRADIITVLREANIASVKDADLRNPTFESVSDLYTRILIYLDVISEEDRGQADFEALQQLENPDHHTTSAPAMILYVKLKQTLEMVDCPLNINFKDMLRPDSSRTEFFISALLNYALHKDSKMELIRPVMEELTLLDEQRREAEAKIATLKAEIAEFDEASERDSPFVQELETSIQELSQKIAELNNEQVSLRATFNKMKEESSQLDEKISKAEFDLVQAVQENGSLRLLIVQSPDKLQGALEEKKLGLEEAKKAERLAIETFQEKAAVLEVYEKAFKKISKSSAQLQLINEQVTNVKAIEKDLKAQKAKLNEDEALYKSLEVNVVERERTLKQLHESLKQLEKEKQVMLDDWMKQLNELKQEIESRRRQLESRQNEVESVVAMVDENAAKTNQVKQSGQAKVKQLADKYEEIVKQAKSRLGKMVERKTTCQAIKSYSLQPETRFGQEHLKNLGPEMMLMKRTKPKKKVKDSSVCHSGKTQSPPSKHDLVVKGTGRSLNYMKGTSSSEARIENKKLFNQKNQTGSKHDGVKKERSDDNKPSLRTVRGLRKTPSFKRCSQRATCSSTMKDSKFPEYLMLNHGGTDDGEVSGTSVLKVCPYTYCSLNGHLHTQYPPLKSFISSRRQSMKSQKSVKMEAPKERKECEVDIETQISETVSVGAPRSEADSNEYSDDTAEMVEFSESDDGTLVEDSVKEGQETSCEVDDSSEMVGVSESDHGVELRESKLEEALVDDAVKEIQETSCEVDDIHSHSAEMVRLLEGDHDIKLKQSDLEETLGDDTVKEIQEKANREEDVDQPFCFGVMKNSEADDTGEEILKDNKTEDIIEESQDQTEAAPIKISFNRTQSPCNQEEESDATISWTIIKCKKPVVETEDSRAFNPREPTYLPIAMDTDTEKVDLKHQDMDERKNSEDWMFDCALQRAVTKLSSARKRKVALLVEAFETVKPIE